MIFTSVPSEEQLEDYRQQQFIDMYYSLECDICGKRIKSFLRSDDFNRPGLIKGPEGIQDAMEAHNMTHYQAPIIYDCQVDDIFGVTHDNCNHRRDR